MTHNDTIRTNAILYLFSDDVNLKLNVKSTEGPSVLTEEPLFSLKETDVVWDWEAQVKSTETHLKTEDLRAYNQSFSLWDRTLDTDMKLKVIQFALKETAPWKSEEDFK